MKLRPLVGRAPDYLRNGRAETAKLFCQQLVRPERGPFWTGARKP